MKKFIKEIFKELLIFLPVLAGLISLVSFGQMHFAWAANYIPLPETICGQGGLPCPVEGGIAGARSLVGKIVDNIRYVIGAVAVIMIIVSAIKLMTAGGNEEVLSKQSESLIFGILGLFFVALAGDLAAVFEVDRGGFLADPNVMIQKSRLFSRTVEIVITFIKYIIASVSVLFIVRNSIRMIAFGGNDEELGKDKKNIFYGFLGLIIILVSNPIVNKVFFKIDTSGYPGMDAVRPGIDVNALIGEITGITNVVAAIVGPFTLLSLIIGGLMYTFAGADEELAGKAKKVILWSVIGLVIIYGSFAIVSTFVSRSFEGI